MKNFYIKTKFANTINISKIITVHYYEFDNSFVYPGESHDFWEMVYVDKGQVLVTSDTDRIVLGQEEIIFHKPNEFHAIQSYHSSPDCFVLSFECNSAQMKNFEKYHTKLNKKLKSIIASIIEESDNTYVIPKNDVHLKRLKLRNDLEVGGEQLIKIYLEQLFILMLRDIFKTETKVFPSKEILENHIVSLIKKFVSDHIGSRITLADICRELRYGKSYLSKIFHFYTGHSIIDYANGEKIRYAKQLIRDGTLNMTEISNALSFDNPQYFSVVFKKYTSLTPTEFRRSLSL